MLFPKSWRPSPPPPVFFLSALLLLLGAGAAWYVKDLYQDLSDVVAVNVASVRAAEELEIGLREIRSRLNESIYTEAGIGWAELEPLKANADRWLAEADRLATTDHEKEMMDRVKRGYAHFFSSFQQVLGRQPEAFRRETRDLIDVILTREIIAPAHQYLDYNEATMMQVAREHRVVSGHISLGLLAIGICGSIGGFCAGALARRRFKRSIVELNLPLSLAAGKLSEVVGPIRVATSLDLPELKILLEKVAAEVDQVVARLQQTQQEVLRSEKLAAIGQLAAGIAHEIRNPLMAIQLLVQAALARGGASSLTDDDLELIARENVRIERTAQNLLDFARPPALARRRFAVAELVENCVALVSGRAAMQRVGVVEETRGAAEAIGDFQQLQQVILNMLLNALDSTPGGGKIRIVAETIDEDGEPRLKISVADDGHGIPEGTLPKIFDPFVSTKETGTGLGLSISKQIVEAHQGEMFARNRPSGGAVVGFLIPLSGTTAG